MKQLLKLKWVGLIAGIAVMNSPLASTLAAQGNLRDADRRRLGPVAGGRGRGQGDIDRCAIRVDPHYGDE